MTADTGFIMAYVKRTTDATAATKRDTRVFAFTIANALTDAQRDDVADIIADIRATCDGIGGQTFVRATYDADANALHVVTRKNDAAVAAVLSMFGFDTYRTAGRTRSSWCHGIVLTAPPTSDADDDADA